MTPVPKRPKKRGVASDIYAEALAQYHTGMRRNFAAIAAFNRERAVRIGITHYVWLGTPGPYDCSVARRNNGKVFSYLVPPSEGHVGECQCEADWCRCIAKPIVPGFS